MAKLEKTYLSLTDVNVLKGFSLILLLVHHLFSKNTGNFDDISIGGLEIVTTIAQISNICVAIFVLLSGYGLTRKWEISGIADNLGKYYKQRYVKLLFNFWFIWVLFVGVELLMGGRTFVDVYHHNVAGKALLDFFGLSYLFGFYGYNPTWWFMSLIIILYALFPFLYRMAKQYMPILLLLSATISLLPFDVIGYMQCYLFSFCCGISMAIIGNCRKLDSNKLIHGGVLLVIIIVGIIDRKCSSANHIFYDGLVAIATVMLYQLCILPRFISISLEFMGKHSMNVFLFHTFIFSYWFKEFIYCTRNPFLIFCLLMGLCLTISLVIERMKKWIGFNKLIKAIINR